MSNTNDPALILTKSKLFKKKLFQLASSLIWSSRYQLATSSIQFVDPSEKKFWEIKFFSHSLDDADKCITR